MTTPTAETTQNAQPIQRTTLRRGDIRMNRKASWWLTAVLGIAVLPGIAFGQATRWQTDHDAGWNAYSSHPLTIPHEQGGLASPPRWALTDRAVSAPPDPPIWSPFQAPVRSGAGGSYASTVHKTRRER